MRYLQSSRDHFRAAVIGDEFFPIGEIGQGLEVFLMVSMGGRHANSIN